MEKRLGKKVYRKMPTMQVMTGCLCITVCNDLCGIKNILSVEIF